jgi:hypothetical protein
VTHQEIEQKMDELAREYYQTPKDDHGGIIHGDTIVDDIGRLRMISTPNKITIKSHGNPTFNIGFGKGQPLEGKPVIPTLHHLAEVMSKTLDVFENYLR